jgi:hypothetical protein
MLCVTASRHNPSEEYKLFEWLRRHGLDHYHIGFVQSELTDFSDIARLNLPDESLYDELEMTLPGHKRRLERAGNFVICFYSFIRLHFNVCFVHTSFDTYS